MHRARGLTAAAAAALAAATPVALASEPTASSKCDANQTCQTSLTTRASTLQVTAPPSPQSPDRGSLTESANRGTPLQCTGYAPLDPSWYSYATASANRSKLLDYTIQPAVSQPEIVGNTHFCLGAPYEFITNSGEPAPPGTLPDGTSGFIGLLPRCSSVSGPCVDSRTKTPDPTSPVGFDIVLQIRIPAGLPGDPWGRA
jgi:hypothetical protein